MAGNHGSDPSHAFLGLLREAVVKPIEVARVLDGAGIYYNEVRGDNVATLNTEDLYLLDATELLTVG
jgi:hypothetical protein